MTEGTLGQNRLNSDSPLIASRLDWDVWDVASCHERFRTTTLAGSLLVAVDRVLTVILLCLSAAAIMRALPILVLFLFFCL